MERSSRKWWIIWWVRVLLPHSLLLVAWIFMFDVRNRFIQSASFWFVFSGPINMTPMQSSSHVSTSRLFHRRQFLRCHFWYFCVSAIQNSTKKKNRLRFVLNYYLRKKTPRMTRNFVLSAMMRPNTNSSITFQSIKLYLWTLMILPFGWKYWRPSLISHPVELIAFIVLLYSTNFFSPRFMHETNIRLDAIRWPHFFATVASKNRKKKEKRTKIQCSVWHGKKIEMK